jgi:hypothetical protein
MRVLPVERPFRSWGIWTLKAFALSFLVIGSCTVFGFGVAWYLKSQREAEDTIQALAKVLENKNEAPVTSAARNEQSAAAKSAAAGQTEAAGPTKAPKASEEPTGLKKGEEATTPKAAVAKENEGTPNLDDKAPAKAFQRNQKTTSPPLPDAEPTKKNSTKVPAEASALAPELAGLAEKLVNGTNEEKGKAAAELAKRGESARQAAMALCQAAVDPAKEVSRAALEALEKVAPDLHEPVFTLVVDGQAGNHLKAIGSLRDKGAKANPTLPVILYQVRKCLNDLRKQTGGRFGGGWQANTLVEVIAMHLVTLSVVAPESRDALKTILDATRFTLDQPIFIQPQLIGARRSLPSRPAGRPSGSRPQKAQGFQQPIFSPGLTITPFRSTARGTPPRFHAG